VRAPGPDRFDFPAFSAAFAAKDVDAWLGFYAEDADWIEYRHDAPPSRPVRMAGRRAIERFLRGVARSPIELVVSDEVVGSEHAAFRVTATFPDGRRIIEHVIVDIADGRIRRQVDVEAWDP
jgi:ketosteroid isomerase-like protein